MTLMWLWTLCCAGSSMGKEEEAVELLRALGMPAEQQSLVAVYTLLTAANIQPDMQWKQAEGRRFRPHDVIVFARRHYGKVYAENTRETIRRRAIHQMVQGGVLARNPDDPGLPTNSPRTHYALTEEALRAVRAFGTREFEREVKRFLRAVSGGLARRYARPRRRRGIGVEVCEGCEVWLSPGKHNELQRAVVMEFRPRFAPGAKVVYLGDTDRKILHVEREELSEIGVSLEAHEKLPDVVLLEEGRSRLFLIEAVSSHGPVSPKRHMELEKALEKCRVRRVYVSAFGSFREFKKFADSIAWETEVWIAEAPSHLLHYNGDKFLRGR